MDANPAIPNGDLLLASTWIDTYTRNGKRACVFAETGRKYFGAYYHNDLLGWNLSEWYKPRGNYRHSGKSAGMDLNLTHRGMDATMAKEV